MDHSLLNAKSLLALNRKGVNGVRTKTKKTNK